MKKWLTVSEWYPVYTLSNKRDIASSSDLNLEISQELWEEWKSIKKSFKSFQHKLGGIYNDNR